MTQIPARLQSFDELLERQILMRIGFQCRRANLRQQCPGNSDVSSDLGAKNKRINEQANQVFEFRTTSPGDW